ncbi:MAG: hypothetical protein AAGA59_08195 [Actinomycetota bacterium]
MAEAQNLAWDLLVELRKEIVELQRLRAQTVGLKITAVGAGVGLIVANSNSVGLELLAIPAIAALFFDLLSNGYGIRVKRIGSYIGEHLEPQLKVRGGWDDPQRPLWEQHMKDTAVRQWYTFYGQFGLSLIASIAATWGLTTSETVGWLRWPGIGLLLVLVGVNLAASRQGWRIVDAKSTGTS